jgi:O-acetylserine/cysteine efflux transporter
VKILALLLIISGLVVGLYGQRLTRFLAASRAG